MTAAPTKKTAPPAANPLASAEFFAPVIKLPQGDGSMLVKAGQPQMVSKEIGTTQFAKETGMSQRWVEQLCIGGFIKHRRMSPIPGSKILIPRSEVRRFMTLSDDAGMLSKMPSGDLAGILAAKIDSGAPRPIAKRGGNASGVSPKRKKPALR